MAKVKAIKPKKLIKALNEQLLYETARARRWKAEAKSLEAEILKAAKQIRKLERRLTKQIAAAAAAARDVAPGRESPAPREHDAAGPASAPVAAKTAPTPKVAETTVPSEGSPKAVAETSNHGPDNSAGTHPQTRAALKATPIQPETKDPETPAPAVEDATAPAAPAKKVPAPKVAGTSAAGDQSGSKKAAAKQAATKQAPAKKEAAPPVPATKAPTKATGDATPPAPPAPPVSDEKPAIKKSTTKKPSTKKAAPKKTSAQKTASKKAASKKASTSKAATPQPPTPKP